LLKNLNKYINKNQSLAFELKMQHNKVLFIILTFSVTKILLLEPRQRRGEFKIFVKKYGKIIKTLFSCDFLVTFS